jgi:hypothetical protein
MLFSLIYNGPLLILCLFWLLFRTKEYERFQLWRTLIDIAILSIAIARFYGASIPPSGHAVFLTHSLISVSNRYYRLAALMMLIVTIGFKISWGDYISWSYGVVLGVISGMVWNWLGSDSGNVLQSGEG